jgi:hypothetical protein
VTGGSDNRYLSETPSSLRVSHRMSAREQLSLVLAKTCVFTEVAVKFPVCWDVTPCIRLSDKYCIFRTEKHKFLPSVGKFVPDSTASRLIRRQYSYERPLETPHWGPHIGVQYSKCAAVNRTCAAPADSTVTVYRFLGCYRSGDSQTHGFA